MSSARSTLGDDERSSRAPARPSITQRNPVPSNWTAKQVSHGGRRARPDASTIVAAVEGPDQDVLAQRPASRTANWFAKTYTTPWLSAVRIVQPERPNPFFGLNGLFVASVTCFVCPGVAAIGGDRATISGVGAAFPLLRLRNEAQQTYALPKNGLSSSWSAQICSLSLKVVEDCLLDDRPVPAQLSCVGDHVRRRPPRHCPRAAGRSSRETADRVESL